MTYSQQISLNKLVKLLQWIKDWHIPSSIVFVQNMILHGQFQLWNILTYPPVNKIFTRSLTHHTYDTVISISAHSINIKQVYNIS